MPLNRILLYVQDVDAAALFYQRHFGFEIHRDPKDRIIELLDPTGGAILMLHQAAKGQRRGQSTVKLVFDVEDIATFCARAAVQGLVFESIHHADGYDFANAKDPDGNSISVSSRAFRKAY